MVGELERDIEAEGRCPCRVVSPGEPVDLADEVAEGVVVAVVARLEGLASAFELVVEDAAAEGGDVADVVDRVASVVGDARGDRGRGGGSVWVGFGGWREPELADELGFAAAPVGLDELGRFGDLDVAAPVGGEHELDVADGSIVARLGPLTGGRDRER